MKIGPAGAGQCAVGAKSCSRSIMGRQANAESVQSAKVVIRKE